MENAARKIDNATEKFDSAVNNAKLSVADSAGNLLSAAGDIATKFKSVSGDAVKESVTFAKKYPLHTALGAVVVGFLAGILVRRR